MNILKTPDTIMMQPFEVNAALAAYIKQKTGRDLVHIVKMNVHDVSEIGSEEHKLATITVTLRDEK